MWISAAPAAGMFKALVASVKAAKAPAAAFFKSEVLAALGTGSGHYQEQPKKDMRHILPQSNDPIPFC